MTFNRPQAGGGDVFKPADHNNELVLVWPRDMRYNVTTPNGPADAMACDIIALDGPAAGAKFINTLLFSQGLQNNLQSYLGDPNPALGRILHVQLPGGKTTWNLADFSDADAENAAAYLQQFPHNPAPVQQAPAPQAQQAPAAGGWGAAPAAQARPQQTQEQAAAAFRGDPALAAPAHVQANTWGANAAAHPTPEMAAPAAAPSWAQPAAAAPAAAPAAYAPPVAAAAPQAAAGAWNAVDVQNCLLQGLDDQTIAQTTGAPLQAVAAIRAAGPQ